MKLLRAYLSTLDLIAPSISARLVYKVLSNPRVNKLRDFESEVLDQAFKSSFQFNRFEIQKYTWGETSNKIALMVHGWEGHAGNFGGLVSILTSKGYRVIAFDAPSHGNSTKAPTNLFDYIAVVSKLVKEHQPDLIVSHSFGSIASAVALTENPEIQINQWILVTSPYSFGERLEEVKNIAKVTDRTISRLIRKFETDTKQVVAKMNMTEYCSQIKNINEALIIHSVDDQILPIQTSRRVHAVLPQSEMIELKKLGHYRILWSAELKEIVKERVV